MRPSTNDFYVGVAAAIPVLVVAYSVGVAVYLGRLGPSYERDARITVASALGALSRTTGRLGNAARALARFVLWTKNLALLGTYWLLVVVPLGGEVAALYALTNGSSQLTEVLSWAGLGAAVLAVGVPLLIAGLEALPFWSTFSTWREMQRMLKDVHAVYDDWVDRSKRTEWANPEIKITVIEKSGNEAEVAASERESLEKVVENVWQGVPPAWQEARLIDNGVLVLDQAGELQGATFFALERRKVMRLIAYRDRRMAETAHPQLGDKQERSA
jgi:hypothetical protein